MSSDSSVTVRDESGEPLAKRQKTFDYGPEALVLRVDTTCDGSGSEEYIKTVAVVSAAKFHRATKGRFKTSPASMTHNGTQLMDTKMSIIIFRKELESVIRALAHWVQEDDIDEAVLKACDADDGRKARWVQLLFHVIEFWLRNNLDKSVHDRLIDCFIEWLKEENNQGSDMQDAIENIDRAVQSFLWAQIPDFKADSRVIPLLACLTLYYDPTALGPCDREERFEENSLSPDINDEAYTYLLAKWNDGVNVPEDPLEDDFDQHCRYHLHGDKEACYKQKQSWRA
ncbi:hypothetical protein KCU81_g8193, partial [Aureobasidium melanogenum]|uniref:Uncharacterized protein n=1 Tax=Aureobasidium melanogenum (strain CBS 110374) TaxID=1043003 RepID=A0A074W418_AURM1